MHRSGLRRNLEVYSRVADDFHADAVISDFESWAYLYGLARRIPVISIDNMQVLNRCAHDEFVTDDKGRDFRLAKAAVKIKLPGAFHYLVSSFFYPPVRKPRTTLVPPILRPEILNARREPGRHILVYQTSAANQALLPAAPEAPAGIPRVRPGPERPGGQRDPVRLRRAPIHRRSPDRGRGHRRRGILPDVRGRASPRPHALLPHRRPV